MSYYIVESDVHMKCLLVKTFGKKEAIKIAMEKLNRENEIFNTTIKYDEKSFVAIEINELIKSRVDGYKNCITLC